MRKAPCYLPCRNSRKKLAKFTMAPQSGREVAGGPAPQRVRGYAQFSSRFAFRSRSLSLTPSHFPPPRHAAPRVCGIFPTRPRPANLPLPPSPRAGMKARTKKIFDAYAPADFVSFPCICWAEFLQRHIAIKFGSVAAEGSVSFQIRQMQNNPSDSSEQAPTPTGFQP